MNALTGMEKFSHLEDKIYLTIDYAKKMRDEKERLERESHELRRDAENAIAERQASDEKVALLLAERDTFQLKVDAMLEALALLDTDVAKAISR